MWTRGELKDRAKNVLRTNYWQALLVSIIIAIAGGGSRGSSGGGGQSGAHRARDDFFSYESRFYKYIFIAAAVVIALILIRIFIGYLLEVGGRKYFIQAAQGNVSFGYVGFAFKDGAYIKIVLTMLYRAVLIFLWTLLLIIPGIIKSYAYRMVPYILADNPEIGYSRAIELSNQMTSGEKFDIFVLDLSFIGWYFLGTLALLIGVIFVMPYEDATNAELYLRLRDNAIENGICSREELNLWVEPEGTV